MAYPLIPDITFRANTVIKSVESFGFYATEDLLLQRFSSDEDLPARDEIYGAVLFDGEDAKGQAPQRDSASNLQEVDSSYRIVLFSRRDPDDYGQRAIVLLQSAIPQVYSAFSGWAPKVRSGANSSFCPGLVSRITRPHSTTNIVYITVEVVWPYVTSVAADDYSCIFDEDKVSPWYIDSTTGQVVFTTGPNEEPA